MAGVLCVDIHRFGAQTSAQQASSRASLIEALRGALAALRPSDWWQVDVQHGVLIVCPASPDHVMYLAQAMLHQPDAMRWCMGLHLGMLQRAPDLEGRAQTVGDGVGRARFIASQAAPGQALASPAFVAAVKDVRPAYAGLLQPLANGESTASVVSASAEWFHALKADLTQPPSVPNQTQPEPSALKTPQRVVGVADDEALPWAQVRELIARWFVPINALLFSIGLLLSQGHRVGLSAPRLLGLGLCLTLTAIAWLWWFRGRRTPTQRRLGPVAWVGLAYGGLLSLAAFMAQGLSLDTSPLAGDAAVMAPAEAAPTPSGTALPSSSAPTQPIGVQPSSPGPAASAAPTVVTRVPVQPDAPSRVPRTISRADDGPSTPTPTPTRRPAATAAGAAVAPAPVAATIAARCSAIVARSALGEPLSAEDHKELMTSCR